MRSMVEFNRLYIERITGLFKILRNKKGLSLSEMAGILMNEYCVKMDGNLLGKIENNKSKIQIEQFLALMHFHELRLSDVDGIFSLQDEEFETKVARYAKMNPDLDYIFRTCIQNATNLSFTNHIKNLVKTSIPFLDKKDSATTTLKVASPSKNSQD